MKIKPSSDIIRVQEGGYFQIECQLDGDQSFNYSIPYIFRENVTNYL